MNCFPSKVINWVENISRKMDFIEHLHKLATRSDIKLEILTNMKKIKVCFIFLFSAKIWFFNHSTLLIKLMISIYKFHSIGNF